MKMKEIIATLKRLAQTQGGYGRIVSAIEEMNEREYEQLTTELERQNFHDIVDLILYFES